MTGLTHATIYRVERSVIADTKWPINGVLKYYSRAGARSACASGIYTSASLHLAHQLESRRPALDELLRKSWCVHFCSPGKRQTCMRGWTVAAAVRLCTHHTVVANGSLVSKLDAIISVHTEDSHQRQASSLRYAICSWLLPWHDIV